MTTFDGDTADGAGRDEAGDGDVVARELEAATEPGPSPRRGAWLVAAGFIVALTVVVALVAVTRSPADDRATPTPTTAADPTQREAIEQIGVAAAYDGKASMRLPITVTPNRDLVDGQTVTVSGSGFPPGADIGVLMCTNEAVFAGIAACDISTAISSVTGPGVTADPNGSFSVRYQVRFRFNVADPDAAPQPPATSYVDPSGNTVVISGGSAPMRQIDCGAGDIDPDVWPGVIPPTAESDPGGFTCIIAAGMVTDYDKSGGAAIGAAGATFRSFTADEIHAPPTVTTAVPTTEVAPPTSAVGQLPTTSVPPVTVTPAVTTTVIGSPSTTTGTSVRAPKEP